MTKQLSISGAVLALLIATAPFNAHASYSSTLKKWTRSGQSFSVETMDARLLWKATFLSEEMVAAQKEVEAKRLKRPSTVSYNPTTLNFFVSIYASEELKDFSLDEKSPWKIYLVGKDGTETSVGKIVPVTVTATERFFYPYLHRWNKAYIVEFPTVPLGDKTKLILRSILAESVLEWKMKMTNDQIPSSK